MNKISIVLIVLGYIILKREEINPRTVIRFENYYSEESTTAI